MKITRDYLDELTYQIIGAAIEVHKELGPGLLEKIYETCLVEELEDLNFKVARQNKVKIKYKGKTLDSELQFDLLVEDLIIIELKAVEKIHPVYEAQLMSYMKLMKKPKGILINFNCTNIFHSGQKTFVNEIYASHPKSE